MRKSDAQQKVKSINSKMVTILRFSKRSLKADNLIEEYSNQRLRVTPQLQYS